MARATCFSPSPPSRQASVCRSRGLSRRARASASRGLACGCRSGVSVVKEENGENVSANAVTRPHFLGQPPPPHPENPAAAPRSRGGPLVAAALFHQWLHPHPIDPAPRARKAPVVVDCLHDALPI